MVGYHFHRGSGCADDGWVLFILRNWSELMKYILSSLNNSQTFETRLSSTIL